MNKEWLLRSVAGGGFIISSIACQPSASVSERAAISVSEQTPQSQPVSREKPYDPLDRLIVASGLVYDAFRSPNSLILRDEAGDIYQLSPPPYLEGVNVLMWRRRATCALPTDEGNKIYSTLLENYKKGEKIDKNRLRAAIGQVIGCKPIMENRWQRRHPQKQ